MFLVPLKGFMHTQRLYVSKHMSVRMQVLYTKTSAAQPLLMYLHGWLYAEAADLSNVIMQGLHAVQPCTAMCTKMEFCTLWCGQHNSEKLESHSPGWNWAKTRLRSPFLPQQSFLRSFICCMEEAGRTDSTVRVASHCPYLTSTLKDKLVVRKSIVCDPESSQNPSYRH